MLDGSFVFLFSLLLKPLDPHQDLARSSNKEGCVIRDRGMTDSEDRMEAPTAAHPGYTPLTQQSFVLSYKINKESKGTDHQTSRRIGRCGDSALQLGFRLSGSPGETSVIFIRAHHHGEESPYSLAAFYARSPPSLTRYLGSLLGRY